MKTGLAVLGSQHKLRLRLDARAYLRSAEVSTWHHASTGLEGVGKRPLICRFLHSEQAHREAHTIAPASFVRTSLDCSVGKMRFPADAHALRAHGLRCFSSTAITSHGPGRDLTAFRRDLYEMGKMLKRGNVARVLAMFEELKESGSATHLHYNMAISALASSRDPARAGDLFDELDARGEADAYSYGAYVSALCRAGKLKEAVALVDKMAPKRVPPNLVIYNTLLHGAVTAGHLSLGNSAPKGAACLFSICKSGLI